MTYFPIIGGPIAPYSNVPIAPQNYQPSQFEITDVTYGSTTTVTMDNGLNDVSPNYVIGQWVRLFFPTKYGASQLSNRSGMVLSIPSTNSVEIGINSVGTDPFIASPTFSTGQNRTPPQIVAIGNIANGQINSTGRVGLGTYPPGSFINISP